jgi:hypothetical protein
MDTPLEDTKRTCLVMAALCFTGAAAIHAVQIAKHRDRNRYVVAACSGADKCMEWEFFDSRGAAECAYDKVYGVDTKVLLDVRNGESPARCVLSRSGEKSAVERMLMKLRIELLLNTSAQTSSERELDAWWGCWCL